MIASILTIWSNMHTYMLGAKHNQKSLDVLTAFIRDAEHELIALIIVLQAQVDLLKSEQFSNVILTDRFPGLNRAIARLIVVTDFLASISEHTQDKQSKQKVILEELMQEISADTKLVFTANQVVFSYKIAKGTQLLGLIGPLKTMITSVLLTVLHTCHKLETINVISLRQNKRWSLSFGIGLTADAAEFKPWQLGKLHQLPTNGEGIGLAAVDAMARLSNGMLFVSNTYDQRHAYKLSFAA